MFAMVLLSVPVQAQVTIDLRALDSLQSQANRSNSGQRQKPTPRRPQQGRTEAAPGGAAAGSSGAASNRARAGSRAPVRLPAMRPSRWVRRLQQQAVPRLAPRPASDGGTPAIGTAGAGAAAGAAAAGAQRLRQSRRCPAAAAGRRHSADPAAVPTTATAPPPPPISPEARTAAAAISAGLRVTFNGAETELSPSSAASIDSSCRARRATRRPTTWPPLPRERRRTRPPLVGFHCRAPWRCERH